MQTPTIGRIVHAIVNRAENNGHDIAPAVITCVFRQDLINYRVLLDATPGAMEWRTSLPLFDTEDEARARGVGACFWPPRT